MMNIDDMSDHAKSVMLARLVDIPGLSVRHVDGHYPTDMNPVEPAHEPYDAVRYMDERGRVFYIDLYDPANMPLLAKVIEFIVDRQDGPIMLDKIPSEQIYTLPYSYLIDFFDFNDFHGSMCDFVDTYLASAIEEMR